MHDVDVRSIWPQYRLSHSVWLTGKVEWGWCKFSQKDENIITYNSWISTLISFNLIKQKEQKKVYPLRNLIITLAQARSIPV